MAPDRAPEASLSGSNAAVEIIRRKLRPPPPPEHLIARPRLDGALAETINRHPVLRICATAGAGKTTAIAQATAQQERAVAWLTVDHTDTAPGRLLIYIEAALADVVPDVRGTVTRALAAGLPHVETVGLLAQAADGVPVVLVLDELERLGESADAWAVVAALARYAPESLRIVLVSRRDLPATLCPLPVDAAMIAVGEDDLAFTAPETEKALQLRDVEVDDVAAVMKATGGWVTGVLFEAWRSSEHIVGAGGEADPLHGYLSSHILGQLSADECEFLIVSSLLDEVTTARAEALGLEHAGSRLASLRAAHLPVSWSDGWRTMRCHSRFREYLLDRLHQRDAEELHALWRRHGRLLAGEGHWEEATEELLRAGSGAEAAEAAERAFPAVIERLDFAIVERWLTALGGVNHGGATPLTVAELMIAIAQDDFHRGLAIADRLTALGEREQLAGASTTAAALLGWCYLHTAQLDDLSTVLAAARPGPEVEAVRFCAALMSDLDENLPLQPPPLTGGPLDAIAFTGSYWFGHLNELTEMPASPFVEAVSRPYRIAALRAVGKTQEALALYEATRATNPGHVALHAALGPEVLIDAGRLDDARAAVEQGRRLALASGSLGYRAVNVTAAMKLALRLERNPAAARAALDELERDPAVRSFHFSAEQQDLWYGLALLLEGDDTAALERLQRAVAGMRAGRRILELPTAAIYLAEAEWRTGDEDAADQNADLALETARAQGSNHLLLQALTDFPAVASRRIDAEAGADSAWHELGRALRGQGVAVPSRRNHRVTLIDFGSATIVLDGREVRPGLAKSSELLAYLCLHRGRPVPRNRLLDVLFDGRSDDSARAYVRQAIQRLRTVLPDECGLTATDAGPQLETDAPVTSESSRFEADLAEAARLQGKARLTATLEALRPLERGPYLADVDSAWADERRHELTRMASDARAEAAELAYRLGRLTEARQLAEAALRDDAYREAAWRLLMRIAGALGDELGVISAFQECEIAFARLSAKPSSTTQQLLADLRR